MQPDGHQLNVQQQTGVGGEGRRVPNNTFKTDIALWCYVCTRVLDVWDWMVSG